MKGQESLIEQFKLEKDEEEEERENLSKKIRELSSKIVELERREIARLDADSFASGKDFSSF